MEQQQCAFILQKNNKRCQFPIYKQEIYCHHHVDNGETIPCPIDPNHSIFKNKLDKHIKICTKKRYQEQQEQSKWFQKNINNKVNNDQMNFIDGKYLLQLQQENSLFLSELIQKINIGFEKGMEIYSQVCLDGKNPEDLLLDSQTRSLESRNLKDQLQNNSLISVMKDNNLLKFGAGRGRLTHEVASYNNDHSAHILLELESRRNKFDQHHTATNKNFKRLRTDISHFDINQIDSLFPNFNDQIFQIVGISKHMCGMASDLTLNTMINCDSSKNTNFKGLCLATCCHHRCSKQNYVNLEFLKNIIKLNDMEIELLFRISSWGVKRDAKTSDIDNQDDQVIDKTIKKIKKEEPEYLNTQVKLDLGLKAKRIIDMGRCLFLKSKGYNPQIVKYCQSELTPENLVIIVYN